MLPAKVILASMPSAPELIAVPEAVVTPTPTSPALPVPRPLVVAEMPTPVAQIVVPLLFSLTVTVPGSVLVESSIAATMPLSAFAPDLPMLASAVTLTEPATPVSTA